MATRKLISVKMLPEVKAMGERLSKLQNRSFSNMVEFLIQYEYEKTFGDTAMYNASKDVIQKGPDETLTEEYEKFVSKISK